MRHAINSKHLRRIKKDVYFNYPNSVNSRQKYECGEKRGKKDAYPRNDTPVDAFANQFN